MQAFDYSIVRFFNQFAHRYRMFDHIVVFLSNSDLIKGGLVMAVILWYWFYGRKDPRMNRSFLLSALLGSLISLFFARFLAHALTIRIRPILDTALHFTRPSGVPNESNWTIWSSFPSDHAALFFALLTGVWLVSRRLGISLLIYVVIVICLPRIYVGIHYPSDILAGAALGILSVLLCSWSKIRERWTPTVLNWIDRWPGPAYALLFLLTFEIATLFWDVRTFLYLFDVSV